MWSMAHRFTHDEVEVSVARRRERRRPGIRVYRTRALPADEVEVIEEIPVTSPARTLIDIGAFVSPQLEHVVADAERRGLVPRAHLIRHLERHRGAPRRCDPARGPGRRARLHPLCGRAQAPQACADGLLTQPGDQRAGRVPRGGFPLAAPARDRRGRRLPVALGSRGLRARPRPRRRAAGAGLPRRARHLEAAATRTACRPRPDRLSPPSGAGFVIRGMTNRALGGGGRAGARWGGRARRGGWRSPGRGAGRGTRSTPTPARPAPSRAGRRTPTRA